MQRDQLPVSAQHLPCRVIPFPASKRVGKIRRTAEVLSARRTPTSADRYWQQVVATIERQMRAAGIDDEAVGHELQAFHDAVGRHLSYADWRPDGAA